MSKKISELGTATAITGAELVPIVQSGVTVQTTISKLKTYKVYTALFTQVGTSAPTVTVLENSIGTITLSYGAGGRYYLNSAALFTGTVPLIVRPMGHEGEINFDEAWGSYYGVRKIDSSQIVIETGIPDSGRMDDKLFNQFIEDPKIEAAKDSALAQCLNKYSTELVTASEIKSPFPDLVDSYLSVLKIYQALN